MLLLHSKRQICHLPSVTTKMRHKCTDKTIPQQFSFILCHLRFLEPIFVSLGGSRNRDSTVVIVLSKFCQKKMSKIREPDWRYGGALVASHRCGPSWNPELNRAKVVQTFSYCLLSFFHGVFPMGTPVNSVLNLNPIYNPKAADW